MSCAVTGSSGLLGRGLVRRLVVSGERPRLIDLEVAPTEQSDLPFVHGSVEDLDLLTRAFEGVEVVYHLAAAMRMNPKYERMHEYEILRRNVESTRSVLRAARRAGVRKLVFVSSSAVYGLPRSVPCGELSHPTVPLGAYGASKLEGERLCRQALDTGLDVTILRPMSIVGEGMTGVFVTLYEWIRTGRAIFMLGNGRNRVQMVSTRDLVEACLLAAQAPDARGGTFNIGSNPDTVPTVFEQVKGLIAHAGTRSPILRIPALLLRSAARALDQVNLSPIVREHYLLADRNFILDTRAAREVLGWRPAYDNLSMMTEAYDWYVENGDLLRPRAQPPLRLLNWLSAPLRGTGSIGT